MTDQKKKRDRYSSYPLEQKTEYFRTKKEQTQKNGSEQLWDIVSQMQRA
ncbi:MAG: hypothetical protein V3G42_07705 [Oscillospiraceae bacterium]